MLMKNERKMKKGDQKENLQRYLHELDDAIFGDRARNHIRVTLIDIGTHHSGRPRTHRVGDVGQSFSSQRRFGPRAAHHAI